MTSPPHRRIHNWNRSEIQNTNQEINWRRKEKVDHQLQLEIAELEQICKME